MAAWIWIDARINASVIAAHAIVGTIGIGIAFGWRHGIRISRN